MNCLYTCVYLSVFHQGLFEGSRLSWKCSLTLILCFVFFIFIYVHFSHLDLLPQRFFFSSLSLLLSILKSWYEFKTVVLIFEFGIFLIVIVPCHSTSQIFFQIIFLFITILSVTYFRILLEVIGYLAFSIWQYYGTTIIFILNLIRNLK